MTAQVSKNKLSDLPISLKILVLFLSVCSGLAIVSGIIYYNQAEKVVKDSVRNQASLVRGYAEQEFGARYAEPIERELRLLGTSPQLSNFLMSSKAEALLYRAEVERLLLSLSKGSSIHLTTTFLDAAGEEKIAVCGDKRKRSYRSWTELAQGDTTGRNAAKLFRELNSDKTRELAYSDPFYDAKDRLGILVAIAVQEPEAGGFGGIVLQHCDLSAYIRDISQKKVFDTSVVWIRGSDGNELLSPPEDEIKRDPWPLIGGAEGSDGTHIDVAECKLFGDEDSIMTVVCSIPKEIISRELVPVIRSVTTIFSGLLIVSVFSSFLIAHRISKPIKSLTRAVEGVSGQSLDIELPHGLTDSGDEVGVLASAFTKMTANLKESTTSIDNLNATNNELQASRQQLQTANEQLEANERKLRENMDRLIRFNQLAAKRELRMWELKQEVNSLLSELGRDRIYKDKSEIAEIYASRQAARDQQ